MEEIGVANADPQTLNAEKEVSSNTKTSQKDPDDLKDSLTEVSGSLEDPVTDLYKPSETSKDQRNCYGCSGVSCRLLTMMLRRLYVTPVPDSLWMIENSKSNKRS